MGLTSGYQTVTTKTGELFAKTEELDQSKLNLYHLNYELIIKT